MSILDTTQSSHVENTGEQKQPDTFAEATLRVCSIVNSAEVGVVPKLLVIGFFIILIPMSNVVDNLFTVQVMVNICWTEPFLWFWSHITLPRADWRPVPGSWLMGDHTLTLNTLYVRRCWHCNYSWSILIYRWNLFHKLYFLCCALQYQ